MARRRGQFADLRYPATPTLAHMLTRAYDGTDFQPSRNGDGAMPAGAHSMRECGRATARRRGRFADLRYPATPTFAHICLRGRSMGQIFNHRDTVKGLHRLARTVCESVGERWRDGAGSLLTFGIQSHRCLHPGLRGRSMGQIFNHRETVMGLCRQACTVCESVGGRWRDGAGSLPTFGTQSYRRLAHVGVGGQWDRFWTVEKR
jgi:hypothetical protein